MKKISLLFITFLLFVGCTAADAPSASTTESAAALAPVDTATPPPPTTTDVPVTPTGTPTLARTETAVPPPTETAPPSPTPSPTPTVKPEGPLVFDFAVQRDRETPALEDGNGWDAAWTFAPGVIYHDGQFHMFFTGWSAGGVIRLGHAVSDNGLDFERTSDTFVLEYLPDEPTIGIWTPIPLVLEDGSWAIYVGKNENGRLTNEILRATAPEAEGPWTWDDEPIYVADENGWDADILPESMARTPDGGYLMAYESNWCTDTAVGILYSDDGLSWEPFNDPDTAEAEFLISDPVLSPSGNDHDWDRQALSSPLIFATETGYELFYIGQYRNIGSPMSYFDWSWLGYATSEDGEQWEFYEANPVIEITQEQGCPWMSGVKVDDTYYLYFAIAQGRYGIGVLTGTVTENN